MTDADLSLHRPPIVEAVLDIDCDLPSGRDLAAMEAPARDRLQDRYPAVQKHWAQQLEIRASEDTESTTRFTQRSLQAIRLLQADGKQLVQLRDRGFSFNRLEPYSRLDDYLDEIERTWGIYRELAGPTLVRRVQLRYVNRILVPMPTPNLELDEYLAVGPRLPEGNRYAFTNFFNHYTAIDPSTGLQIQVTLTMEKADGGALPVIFDNATFSNRPMSPDEWPGILGTIRALRSLKNRVFRHTLTEKCLDLFRVP